MMQKYSFWICLVSLRALHKAKVSMNGMLELHESQLLYSVMHMVHTAFWVFSELPYTHSDLHKAQVLLDD